MINSAESMEPFPAVMEEFDQHPNSLNLLNCTIDLDTWKFRDHRREDLITKVAPVIHNSAAKCQAWDQFLHRVLGEDQELVDFVQRAVGYSLTGSTAEEVLFILHGTGANGKSTFVETIEALLGDYAMQTPTETLMMRRGDSIPNDVARLHGARFVSASETEEGRRLAESRVKELTGGDTIVARFLHREFFEFVPEFKLWLACNHKPVIAGTDAAIWRRVRLVPFSVQIPEGERDPALKGSNGKLRAELPGILNWALEGCRDWKENGLGMTDAVKAATNAYRSEMDILSSFLEDRCIEGREMKVKKSELYLSYKTWSEANGERAMTQKKLGMKLSERGLEESRTKGVRFWSGIGLLNL